MEKQLLKFAFIILLSSGMFAQTNVALGKTVTIKSPDAAYDPPYLSSSSPGGLVDGTTGDASTERLLYEFKRVSGDPSDVSQRLPVEIEVDLGASFEINSFQLTEKTDASTYTFETWNGSSWDVQASITGVKTNLVTSGTFPSVTTNKVRLVIVENTDVNSRYFIRLHELEVFQPLASDQEILEVSSGSILDNTSYGITNIAPMSASDLLESLTIAISATAQVLTGVGGTPVNGTDSITSSMIVSITGTGTTQDYTLDVLDIYNVALNEVSSPTVATWYRYSNDTGGDASVVVDGVTLDPDNAQRVSQFTEGEGGVDIDIDFGGNFDISHYKFYNGSGGTWNGPVRDFTFSVWDDAANGGLGGYVVVDTQVNNPDPTFIGGFPKVTTTKIRLNSTNADASGFARYFEVEIFGVPSKTAGVNDVFVNQLSVYPNPVNGDVVFIKSNEAISNIGIYNVVGQKVPCAFNDNQVNISSLSSGLYFMKINNLEVIKFIKN